MLNVEAALTTVQLTKVLFGLLNQAQLIVSKSQSNWAMLGSVVGVVRVDDTVVENDGEATGGRKLQTNGVLNVISSMPINSLLLEPE
jgi:hypothetical protein